MNKFFSVIASAAKQSSSKLLLLAITMLFFTSPCMADPLPLQQFGMLPIAHEGRIKPLAVFAREELKDFYGESKWHKKPAIEWLAQMLFTPEKIEQAHLIELKSEALRQQLALPLRATHRYGLAELRTALREHLSAVLEAVILVDKKRPVTPLQTALAELYAKVQHFQQLQDSLTFLLPFPDDASTTYYELAKQNKTSPLMTQMEERGRMSHILTVIPSSWEGDTDWYSPWQLRFNGKASPQSAAYVMLWKKMADAYRAESTTTWNQAVDNATSIAFENGGSEYHPARLWLEEWYYRLSFISLAIVLYGISLVLFVIASDQRERGNPHFSGLLRLRLAMTGYGLAIGLHGLALIVRMLILQRPPVSNLYESVLFVSLLIACVSGVIAWQKQNRFLAIAAAGMTAFLLLISQSLLSGQEQLPVAMAVLNTDFWLATHVICITAGYAAAVLCSLVAHFALYKCVGESSPPLPKEWPTLRASPCSVWSAYFGFMLPLIALLLTAVGTLLGGIWADQSWGRFWGWDPKENGAMLIVLWLIWLIHARLAGQCSQRWYLAGMAFLSAIVSLAWFGVNLLSVGLHSYGFMEGTAWGLFAFIVCEILIIAALLWRSRDA